MTVLDTWSTAGTVPLAEAPDDVIRARGKLLGRIRWVTPPPGPNQDKGDWRPDLDGDHEGWVYRLAFYALPVQP